ncbi:IclR family transcriptional regulator C-terminal domain-containing protein [Streptomyces sp. NPDC006284]|uniref:IclR family transcriptional regulator domain-containing protein n=1 Tax=Streptomyces sp. NPDC006284 TaxID=3156742 RepID=UPI0033AA9B83
MCWRYSVPAPARRASPQRRRLQARRRLASDTAPRRVRQRALDPSRALLPDPTVFTGQDGIAAGGLVEGGLRVIRERGCAVSEDEVEEGVKALSVPVRDHTGTVVAALSISGLTAHLPASEEEQQLTLLRDAAEKASRALGHF